ncbi:class I SAM-dependent methyltransferase [Microcoleus sp. FACHB-53]|nr:class I SAM-dependent methyltransferase [Microcoleus sp. FACHB-53]
MEFETYAIEAKVAAYHWWFVGRRHLLSKLLKQLALPKDASILDVGTGTGSNLSVLRELGYTAVKGIDSSIEAIHYCHEKGFKNVTLGDIGNLPFPDGTFQLVLATDVIEHIDNDLAALSEIRRVLASEGRAIVTVPAFKILWGTQDEVSHHKRRYLKKELLGKAKNVGFNCLNIFYFNYILFLPILAARSVIKLLKLGVKNENSINNDFLNNLFKVIFTFDVMSSPTLSPPFGVSILALLDKPDKGT